MKETRNNEIIPYFDKDQINELRLDLFEYPEHKNILVVSLSGFIDTYNTHQFNKKMSMIFKKYVNIIFDLSNVTYISSTGIGSFTTFLKEIQQQRGEMVFIEVVPKVYEVFQLLGFTNFFNFALFLEDAWKYFDSSIEQKPKKQKIKEESPFPAIIVCSGCLKKLKIPKAAKYKCPKCKKILVINENGKLNE